MYEDGLIQTALQRGFVTEPDVEAATQRQAELAERGVERSLWLLLQDSGALRGDHARRVERQQSSQKMEALEVDGYVIQGRVGRGGMGDVFLAQNEAGEEVAIKLLPANMVRDEEYLARFRREVDALGAVEHPQITRFVSAGDIDGRPYLIMELIRGQSLKQRLQERGAVGELPCRQILRQLTPALAHAWHSAGLVHRDVKPANILVNEADDGSMTAKLCDFGLAKFAIDPETTRRLKQEDLTQSGVAIGTPHYMSPEQATGDRSADPRHDIYGLGATIYHALLGKTLYSGGSSAVIMYQQATAALDMKPLSRLGIAPAFVDLLSRMLAKPRERRYQDWAAVQRDLDALDDTVLGPQPAADSGKRKPLAFAADGTPVGTAAVAERHRRSLGLVPMILLTVVIVGAAAGFVFAELEDATTARRLDIGPGGLAQAIERARETLRLHGGTVSLRLQAGRYAGPWTFGEDDQGLRLQAVGTVSVSAPHERPGLVLEEGLRDFRIAGVTFTGATGVAIRSAADEADLLDCRVTDSYVVLEQKRGRLRIEGLRTQHCGSGLLLSEQSELDLSKSVLAVGAQHLVGKDATINVRLVRCLVPDRLSGAVIDIDGGVYTARGLIIEGGSEWTGLSLAGVGLVQLADCRIADGRFGLRIADSEVGVLEGLTVITEETAFIWSGPKPDTWRWSRLFFDAALPVQGLSERLLIDALTNEGASEEVLQQVPTLADDQDPS